MPMRSNNFTRLMEGKKMATKKKKKTEAEMRAFKKKAKKKVSRAKKK